jgi:hypothetical protein
MKKKSVIQKIELVRKEKVRTSGDSHHLYFFLLWLDGFDEPLLLENLKTELNDELVGAKVVVTTDKNNKISKLDFQ